MNNYKKWLGQIDTAELTGQKLFTGADRMSLIEPIISATSETYIRRMIEEEQVRREQLLGHFTSQTIVEQLKEQFSAINVAGMTGGLAEFRDPNYLKRLIGDSTRLSIDLRDQVGMTGTIAETLRLQNESFRQQIFGTTAFEQAKALALSSERYHLDDYLDSFRTSAGPLTDKMLYLGSLESIQSPEKLKAFVHASTVSDILNSSLGFDNSAKQAWESLTRMVSPKFETIQEYGRVLSAAGLTMPRWPHPRLLTLGERRRKLQQRVKNRSDPKYAIKAWPVIHRLEISLRDVISTQMEKHYGEAWPNERLPRCECNDLLGKWIARGNEVLEHADYAHYIRIMCNPEHFDLIFSCGFNDAAALEALLNKAKNLRATVAHLREFTQEDLRDIRGTWRALESGLLRFISDIDFDYH